MISPLGCIELSDRNRRLSPRKSQWKWQLRKPTRCSGLRVWGSLGWSLFCLQDIWERKGERAILAPPRKPQGGNFLADRAALGLHWVHLSLHLPSCYTDCSGAVIATQTIRYHLCQRIFFSQPLKTELNVTILLLQTEKRRHRGSEGRLGSTSQAVNPRCPDFFSPRWIPRTQYLL